MKPTTDERAITRAIIFAVIIVAALGAIIWGVRVVTAGPKGQGDAYIQRESADNWVAAQQDFHRRYNGILAADKKIGLLAAAAKAAPTNAKAATDLQGTQMVCLQLVGEYNSRSDEYLSDRFRDASLPYKLGRSADTDCN